MGIENSAVLDPETDTLICYSPMCCYDESEDANVPLIVNFEIALNGQQYTSSGIGAVSFRFYMPATVASMYPVYGNFNERLETTVQGENVVETGEIKCKFGDEGLGMIVPGTRGPPSVVGGKDAIGCQCPGPSRKTFLYPIFASIYTKTSKNTPSHLNSL